MATEFWEITKTTTGSPPYLTSKWPPSVPFILFFFLISIMAAFRFILRSCWRKKNTRKYDGKKTAIKIRPKKLIKNSHGNAPQVNAGFVARVPFFFCSFSFIKSIPPESLMDTPFYLAWGNGLWGPNEFRRRNPRNLREGFYRLLETRSKYLGFFFIWKIFAHQLHSTKTWPSSKISWNQRMVNHGKTQ